MLHDNHKIINLIPVRQAVLLMKVFSPQTHAQQVEGGGIDHSGDGWRQPPPTEERAQQAE